jgi:EAL and modified HD-GYP domain-containing signal transduction protein
LLSVRQPALLIGLLDHTLPDGVCLEVNEAALAEPELVLRVRQAHQRGTQLVWHGAPGAQPSPVLAACFVRQLRSLTTSEALLSLRVSLKKHQGSQPPHALKSPVLAGQIYEAMASQALAEHGLDEQGAWGVAGWPLEDVLHSYRHQSIQPSHHAIVKLVEATDADASLEAIEHILSEEPILAYRFLRLANSAAVGLGTEIESLRHGLMVLGYVHLKNWLLEQLPHATSDLNLQPIRTAMVVRAHLMAHLLDAGDGDDLRREVYLCGLMSQIDLLLGESPAAALQRLPLSDRVSAAVLSGTGPYAPYLDMAIALESGQAQATTSTCQAHGFDMAEVNRALLRTLAMAQLLPARGQLLV